jgi:hypothetical protein
VRFIEIACVGLEVDDRLVARGAGRVKKSSGPGSSGAAAAIACGPIRGDAIKARRAAIGTDDPVASARVVVSDCCSGRESDRFYPPGNIAGKAGRGLIGKCIRAAVRIDNAADQRGAASVLSNASAAKIGFNRDGRAVIDGDGSRDVAAVMIGED